MRRSTGSDTGSKRKRGTSLRFKLFVTILAAVLVCLMASAALAVTLSRLQVKHNIEYIERHPDWMGPPIRRGGRATGTMTLGFVLAAIVAVVLALAIGYFLADRMSRPLLQLTAATKRIAGGDYGEKVEIGGGEEIEELGAAFNILSENLERNELLRKHMVADIAHELRTPVATIRAQLEAIQDGILEPDHATIDSLMEDTEMLTRLVEDMQQLSNVEAGQLELDMRAVDPSEMVRGSASRFEPECSRKDISLEAFIEPGLPRVDADAIRVAQVLGNLIKNAVSHTPKEGSIKVGASLSGGEVVFSVADTGPGIDAGELPYIFERFYRTDRSRARETGGAGLGLTIAKSLVEAQGGRIWAESEPGKGAVVCFSLNVSAEGDEEYRE